jgi:hypothetical protein
MAVCTRGSARYGRRAEAGEIRRVKRLSRGYPRRSPLNGYGDLLERSRTQGIVVNFTRLLTFLAALLAFGALAAGSASASTVDECQDKLAMLRANTVAAETSFTNPKSFNNLLGKLDAASTELAVGKSADAAQKLVDFQTTLNTLASAPKAKVDPAVAQSLTAEAQGVIDCVNTVGSS